MPWLEASLDVITPATPARPNWNSDTWPTSPVSRTSDRQAIMPIMETMSAARRLYGSRNTATSPMLPAMTAGRMTRSGGGALGRRGSTSVPRSGRLCPRHSSAITMTTKYTRSVMPGQGTPWLAGNQDWPCA